MASEPTEDGALTVTLPGDLNEWLDDRASDLGVDRERVVEQLLASYRAADDLGDDHLGEHGPALGSEEAVADVVEPMVEAQVAEYLNDELESGVTSVLADTLDDRIEEAVQSQVQAAIESVVMDRLTETVTQQIDERVSDLESTHEQDIEDVRERVIQVKRETDGKAPREHSHEALDRVDDLVERLADVETTVEDLESSVAEHDVVVEDVDERLDDVQDRLQTVAWVVTDLRDAVESNDGLEAVERIKRAAAKADIDRAKCENCGNGVDIALMTDPECPHCQATVTNVEPADSFFSKPQLLVASQLESGEHG